MGEKKGSTVKIKYDFPTEKDCQVFSNGKFYRTTPKDFRSWNGARQIVYYIDNKISPQEYNGPLYYWNTNTICKEPIGEGVQYISSMPRESKPRSTESYLES